MSQIQEESPELDDKDVQRVADESIIEAHRLSLDPVFKYISHQKIEKTGQIQMKANQICKHAKIVDEVNVELASMARQNEPDIDGIQVKITQQKTATRKVNELAVDMQKQAGNLVEMEEAHNKHNHKVSAAIDKGIAAEKKSDARRKKKFEMEAVF